MGVVLERSVPGRESRQRREAAMDNLRLCSPEEVTTSVPCCRCAAVAVTWDRIIDQPYCPNCQEALATGEAPPLIAKTEKNHCTVCNCVGTVRYMTVPLNSTNPIVMDLCPEHLRGLLGRRLGNHAFIHLRRRLAKLGIDVADVFLLHDAFYDANGRALQPAIETIP
jgi:hypothetical protein